MTIDQMIEKLREIQSDGKGYYTAVVFDADFTLLHEEQVELDDIEVDDADRCVVFVA